MTDSFQEGAKLVRRDIDLCTFLPEIGVMKLMKVDGCTGGLYLAKRSHFSISYHYFNLQSC
jgi:hypothetical protein